MLVPTAFALTTTPAVEADMTSTFELLADAVIVASDGTTAENVSVACSLTYIVLLEPSNSSTLFDTVTAHVLVIPLAVAEIVAEP